MYTPDNHDEVIAVAIAPPHCSGAPMPFLIASDNSLTLCYYTGDDEDVVVVPFTLPLAHYFGPPNDEAISGHPLASKGLKSYGIYEVKQSSWIRSLNQMNEVHPRHNPLKYEKRHHYIFTFHDSTFECIADGVGEVKVVPRQTLHELLRTKLPQ